MILVDANVLIALIDERDGLRSRAVPDLQKLRTRRLRVTEAVLSEVCFACPSKIHLRRLAQLIGELNLEPVEEEFLPDRLDILTWMERYAEHVPEWADAQIALIADSPEVMVWTYDQEFHTIWRRMDGTRISLALRS